MNILTGGSGFLSLLKDEGVSHLFGNPGTTELAIMHALSEHTDMPYVLGLQESIVVAMADGFSRASGQLVACNVHVAPGLGNAMGALYNAKFTGTPMILTAGQHEQGHGLLEPRLYDPLVPIASPLVKWAVEVQRIDDLPRVVRRAAKVATTPPTGPVFLSLPGDILLEKSGIDLAERTRVVTRVRPADDLLGDLAERLLRAERPVLLCGDELVKADALQEAGELADLLGAPAYQQTVPFGAHFFSEHPCYIGPMHRSQQKARDTLAGYDLLLVLGCDLLRMSLHSEVVPLPRDLPVLHIGQIDWEMGKNYPAAIAVRADPKETLRALIPLLRKKGGEAQEERRRERLGALEGINWSARRQALSEKVENEASDGTIQPDWLMLQLSRAVPENAIIVDEGLTSSRALQDFYPYRDRYNYHGLASGGIGWGIAAAVGVQLAHPDRPVIAVIGDGSALYSIQALWTAAHLNLPMTYVIANNGSYHILKQRLQSFFHNDAAIGMDLTGPAIDFVSIGNGFGMKAERITERDAVGPALKRALGSAAPYLLDISVAPVGLN